MSTIKKVQKEKNSFFETLRVILEALLIALIIRTFLFQPFVIPSSSMEPNLLVGDYLFVSKYSYGYSKHTFPFSPPLFSGRIWGGEPKRGEVLVFKKPNNTSLDYIKRLIGLPGDRIRMINGILHINGTPLKREKIDERREREWDNTSRRWISFPDVVYYKETNPEGISYTVREALGDRGDFDNTIEYVVPEGHYFMMGDNRDRSEDSRSHDVSFVPYDNLVGRAEVLFFSVEKDFSILKPWNWGSTVRWGRIFNRIK